MVLGSLSQISSMQGLEVNRKKDMIGTQANFIGIEFKAFRYRREIFPQKDETNREILQRASWIRQQSRGASSTWRSVF